MADEWEELLAAERHLQQLVPGSVLGGGTAAALPPGLVLGQLRGMLTGIRQLRRTALASLGEPVNWDVALPVYGDSDV